MANDITQNTPLKLTLGTVVAICMGAGLWMLNDIRTKQERTIDLVWDTRERVARLEGGAGLGDRQPQPPAPRQPVAPAPQVAGVADPRRERAP